MKEGCCSLSLCPSLSPSALSISLSPSPCHISLLTELQAVAAVADLEEEPLQWRAAHAGEPVVLALARSAEAQRLIQLVGSQLDRRRAEDHSSIVVTNSELQNTAAQGLSDAFATVARVHRHAPQLDCVVLLAPFCRHDPNHSSVKHSNPEAGA